MVARVSSTARRCVRPGSTVILGCTATADPRDAAARLGRDVTLVSAAEEPAEDATTLARKRLARDPGRRAPTASPARATRRPSRPSGAVSSASDLERARARRRRTSRIVACDVLGS
jgi:hypothetical protein